MMAGVAEEGKSGWMLCNNRLEINVVPFSANKILMSFLTLLVLQMVDGKTRCRPTHPSKANFTLTSEEF